MKKFVEMLRLFVAFLRETPDRRKYKKITKNRLIVEASMLQLNALTVTIHGRLMLTEVIQDPDNGLPNEIRRMYLVLLEDAPVKEWAMMN